MRVDLYALLLGVLLLLVVRCQVDLSLFGCCVANAGELSSPLKSREGNRRMIWRVMVLLFPQVSCRHCP